MVITDLYPHIFQHHCEEVAFFIPVQLTPGGYSMPGLLYWPLGQSSPLTHTTSCKVGNIMLNHLIEKINVQRRQVESFGFQVFLWDTKNWLPERFKIWQMMGFWDSHSGGTKHQVFQFPVQLFCHGSLPPQSAGFSQRCLDGSPSHGEMQIGLTHIPALGPIKTPKGQSPFHCA